MADTLKIELGAAIKRERSARGISQEELARRAGLHRTYVSDLERGARNPSVESVEKLADALQVSVAKLFATEFSGAVGSDLVEILLVEDNPDDVELTGRAFKKAGLTNPFHVARDGAEALDFLFSAGKYAHRSAVQAPHLILLDLQLPKESGLEVLKRIKAEQRTRDIPVIVLTGSTRDSDIAECRRLGVHDYIVKPVGFQNFSEIIPRLNLGWLLVRGRPAQKAA